MPQYHTPIIEVSGEDATQFLQGQLTNDITQVTLNQFQLNAFCNIKGRVVAIIDVMLTPHGYWLKTCAELTEPLVKRLNQFILRAKVRLEILNLSHAQCILSSHQRAYTCEQLPQNTIAISQPWSGIELLGHPMEIDYWLEKNQALQANTDWQHARLIEGYPDINLSTKAQFLPQELNLINHEAISFKKGCFVGQEVIARLHYLGKIKKSLQLLQSTTSLEYLNDVTNPNGDKVGSIVDFSIADGHYLALALIQNKALDEPLFHQNNPIEILAKDSQQSS